MKKSITEIRRPQSIVELRAELSNFLDKISEAVDIIRNNNNLPEVRVILPAEIFLSGKTYEEVYNVLSQKYIKDEVWYYCHFSQPFLGIAIWLA